MQAAYRVAWDAAGTLAYDGTTLGMAWFCGEWVAGCRVSRDARAAHQRHNLPLAIGTNGRSPLVVLSCQVPPVVV